MADTRVATQSYLASHARDTTTSSGGRLFAKIARSPTIGRKPKPGVAGTTSSPTSDLDQLPSITTIASHSDRGRTRRPSLARNTSAPVVTTTTTRTTTADYIDPTTGIVRTQSNGKDLCSVNQSDAMLAASVSRSHFASTNKMEGPPPPSLVMGSRDALSMQQITTYQFQQLRDLSTKRIATLEYMKKSHEKTKFWFNSVQFSKQDISRLPSYAANKLSRRATNYLLLGMSVPAVLDVHPRPHESHSTAASIGLATEFFKSLNILLTEFESYQQLHPADGSHVSSLTRARIPQIFKRSATTSKPRKSSGVSGDSSYASQISPPVVPDTPYSAPAQSSETGFGTAAFHISSTTLVQTQSNMNGPTAEFPNASSFPPPGDSTAPNSTVLPNEGPYTHLLTPPLPFAPDFFVVFSTLCDVLIDVYQRVLLMVSSPGVCTAGVADGFSKTDARIRKVMVGGIVREFEGAARESVKREMVGVQKVVLGGLMGS